MLLLPQSSWPGLEGAGQGAERHTTQWALPVWSTTHDCGRGHTTCAHDSAGGAPGLVRGTTATTSPAHNPESNA